MEKLQKKEVGKPEQLKRLKTALAGYHQSPLKKKEVIKILKEEIKRLSCELSGKEDERAKKALEKPDKPKPPKRKLTKKEKIQKRRNYHYSFLGKLPFRKNSFFSSYMDYCRSEYFIRLKRAVLDRDKGKCRVCEGEANTAHHTLYRAHWTNSRLTDCIAICNYCHRGIHFTESGKRKPL